MIPPVAASEAGGAQLWKPSDGCCRVQAGGADGCGCVSLLEGSAGEGESPVTQRDRSRARADESGCLGMQPKAGGRSHRRLNMGKRPIANKYREGKMKRTLERG